MTNRTDEVTTSEGGRLGVGLKEMLTQIDDAWTISSASICGGPNSNHLTLATEQGDDVFTADEGPFVDEEGPSFVDIVRDPPPPEPENR